MRVFFIFLYSESESQNVFIFCRHYIYWLSFFSIDQLFDSQKNDSANIKHTSSTLYLSCISPGLEIICSSSQRKLLDLREM